MGGNTAGMVERPDAEKQRRRSALCCSEVVFQAENHTELTMIKLQSVRTGNSYRSQKAKSGLHTSGAEHQAHFSSGRGGRPWLAGRHPRAVPRPKEPAPKSLRLAPMALT